MQPMKALIAIDDNAQFRNDVQLNLFENPAENKALLRSYIFSVTGSGTRRVLSAQEVSSADLLNRLVETYTNSRAENRMVAIANYGHGKSHLALALTNYFSKPFDSEEAQIVLQKLEHALNDEATWQRFYDFKDSRGEFLVLRLRGDIPRSVREQFLPELEKALQEHPQTAEVRPPMWHTYAADILRKLTEEEIARANQILADHRLDVPNLIAQVEARMDVRDRCIEALTEAKGMAPNLGAQLSLAESLEWVADELCGEGKPLAGVLVLFDEFSLYIQRYAQGTAVGELQDLLNGVSNRRTKVSFLAFAQHDPLTVADNSSLSAHGRDTLRHQLTRIPEKMALHTLLENVLKAYLRQRPNGWNEFAEDRAIKGALSRAGHIAYEAFEDRYANMLMWAPSGFDEQITKGTFPLHPLTTALLCNLKFQDASGMSDPRTVLGFVMDHLHQKMEETTIVNGLPNWVYPAALVDYFGQNISPDLYPAFQNAIRNLPIGTPREAHKVLKALFLQMASKVKFGRDQQVEFLTEASGIDFDQTKDLLRELSGPTNIIRYDAHLKTYSFWPVNADPGKLERVLSRKMDGLTFDTAALDQLNRKFAELYNNTFRVPIDWGHPDDWAAVQHILTPETFDAIMLKTLAKRFTITSRTIEDGDRGIVIWLLVQNEEEMRWCQESLNPILDEVLSDNTYPPLFVVLPQEEQPDLIRAFQRVLALESFTTAERNDVGMTIYEHETTQANTTLLSEFLRFFGGEPNNYIDLPRTLSSFAAPAGFRSSLHLVQSPNIRSVMLHLYTQGYSNNPKEFFTQYKAASTTRLKKVVTLVAGFLYTGKTTGMKNAISTDSVANDTCTKFLIQRWGMLTSQYELREPNDLRIRRAWSILEETFAPGTKEKKVANTLTKLLNPPNGYDYNTLTLLFTGWFGFHVYDFDLVQNGRKVSKEILNEYLQNSPKDFLVLLKAENIALSRRNPDEDRREIEQIISKTNRSGFQFAQKEAEESLKKLQAFAEDTAYAEREREAASKTAKELHAALTQVKEYGRIVEDIEKVLSFRSDYRELISQLSQIGSLPTVRMISMELQGPEALRAQLLDKIAQEVENQCSTMEAPDEVINVGLNQRQLEILQTNLHKAELLQFDQRINQARQKLSEHAKTLQSKEAEQSVRDRVNGIDINRSTWGQLSTAQIYLNSLTGYSDKLLELRDRKLAQVQQERDDLAKRVNDLPDTVASVQSRHQVNTLRDEWNRLLSRYEDSENADTVRKHIEILTELRSFFEQVERLPSRPDNPKDVVLFSNQVQAIQEQYVGLLKEAQHTALKRAEQGYLEAVEQKQSAAIQRLNQSQQRIQNAGKLSAREVSELQAQLASPPEFLPDSHFSLLEDLRNDLQQQLEENAMLQIETAFRKIADKKRRQECVDRLSAILHEESTPFWERWGKKEPS